MSRENVIFFEEQLTALINHQIRENSLSLAEAVGVLECKKIALIAEALESDEDGGEDWRK